MTQRLENTAVLMEFGFWGYPLIEILFRGWSHWSMAIAGSVCFSLIGNISERLKEKNILLKCAVSSASITCVELLFGCIFNLGLNMNIWDYSGEIGNLAGQICPRFSIIWFIMSVPVMAFADLLTGNR